MNDIFAVTYPKQFLESEPIDIDEKDDTIDKNGKKMENPFIKFDSDEEFEKWKQKRYKKHTGGILYRASAENKISD